MCLWVQSKLTVEGGAGELFNGIAGRRKWGEIRTDKESIPHTVHLRIEHTDF